MLKISKNVIQNEIIIARLHEYQNLNSGTLRAKGLLQRGSILIIVTSILDTKSYLNSSDSLVGKPVSISVSSGSNCRK
jgi:hypothetical protein